MNSISIFVDDEAIYDFERDIDMDEERLTFLDKMDSDLDKGIKIKGDLISRPDSEQRAIFVAMNLIVALQQNNDAAIQDLSTYLAHRHPILTEVHVNDGGDTINVEFINEK